jgi:hypothetical protein
LAQIGFMRARSGGDMKILRIRSFGPRRRAIFMAYFQAGAAGSGRRNACPNKAAVPGQDQ